MMLVLADRDYTHVCKALRSGLLVVRFSDGKLACRTSWCLVYLKRHCSANRGRCTAACLLREWYFLALRIKLTQQLLRAAVKTDQAGSTCARG